VDDIAQAGSVGSVPVSTSGRRQGAAPDAATGDPAGFDSRAAAGRPA
jgi:hypothetical protein